MLIENADAAPTNPYIGIKNLFKTKLIITDARSII